MYELLLKSGFELATPIEHLVLEGKTVFSIAGGVLLICLEKQLTHDLLKAMAALAPSRVICLDEGFQDNDQLKTNAVQMMRSKIRFYEFADRIEISNTGGLYGAARPDNFPHQNDYRNPVLAEAMKILGYVNRFNRGIATAKKALLDNGNPEPVFKYDLPLQFGVTVCKKVSA